MPTMRFDTSTEGRDDDPWTKLATIAEHLDAGTAVPSHLAQWFGLAVQYADENPNELLRRLGLKSGRGNPGHWTAEHAYRLGQAVCQREDNGDDPDAAIIAVLGEYEAQNDGEAPSRTTLQRWRDDYRAAHAEANRP